MDDITESLHKAIQPAVKEGKFDLESLRKTNVPLAEVLAEFVAAKTTRDDPALIVKDLERVMAATDPKSKLSQALDNLQKHMKGMEGQ